MSENNIWNELAVRALRTGAAIPSVEMQFDAELARQGLIFNFANNRKSKPVVINNMVKSIEEGSFAQGTVLRIAFDHLLSKYVLVDGQHRLEAVVASNTKQWFIVTVDARPAHVAYATLDRLGSMRTEGDSINGAIGWKTKYWNAIIGGIRLVSNSYDTNSISGGGKKKKTPKEVIQLAEEIAKYKHTLIRIGNLSDSSLVSSTFRGPSAAVFIPAAHWQPDIFFPWIEKAICDKSISFNSIEMRLYDLANMECSSHETRCKLLIYAACVWNAKFYGRPMEKLPRIVYNKERKSEFPGVAGTPYAK